MKKINSFLKFFSKKEQSEDTNQVSNLDDSPKETIDKERTKGNVFVHEIVFNNYEQGIILAHDQMPERQSIELTPQLRQKVSNWLNEAGFQISPFQILSLEQVKRSKPGTPPFYKVFFKNNWQTEESKIIEVDYDNNVIAIH